MKKLFLWARILVLAMLCSSLAYADDDDDDRDPDRDDWDVHGYYVPPPFKYYYPVQPQTYGVYPVPPIHDNVMPRIIMPPLVIEDYPPTRYDDDD